MNTHALTLTCRFCDWKKDVNFTSQEMPGEAQVIVASMGAAIFDHELQMHVSQAHPLTTEVGTLKDGAFRITRRNSVVVGVGLWPDRARPEVRAVLVDDR